MTPIVLGAYDQREELLDHFAALEHFAYNMWQKDRLDQLTLKELGKLIAINDLLEEAVKVIDRI